MQINDNECRPVGKRDLSHSWGKNDYTCPIFARSSDRFLTIALSLRILRFSSRSYDCCEIGILIVVAIKRTGKCVRGNDAFRVRRAKRAERSKQRTLYAYLIETSLPIKLEEVAWIGQVGRKRWKISRVGEEEDLCQICDRKGSRIGRKNPETSPNVQRAWIKNIQKNKNSRQIRKHRGAREKTRLLRTEFNEN